MGLFSSKTVIYVSSVAYNLAGDEVDRVNVMKSNVARHVMLGEKKIGLGERIVDTQIKGPTMNQRAWFRWCKSQYDIGQVSGGITKQQAVDPAVVLPFLPTEVDHTTEADTAIIDIGDISYWAEQWLLVNNPDAYYTSWLADHDLATNQMTITYEDLSTVTVSTPDYSVGAKYLICHYRLLINATLHNRPRVFIYKIGTGNATLDALVSTTTPKSDFFPAIPLRINNKSIAHADFDEVYPKVARAYKKGIGGKIEDTLADIADNENIGDIDYAHIVFGVELTTKEKCGLRYLYEFFKNLIPEQLYTTSQMASWMALSTWRAEPPSTIIQIKGIYDFGNYDPSTIGSLPIKQQISMGLDNRLSWINVTETVNTGLGKPDAKVGDLWFVAQPDIVVPPRPVQVGTGSPNDTERTVYVDGYSIPHATLFWQTGTNTHRRLELYGMMHRNYVYKDKAVRLTTTDALTGEDEEGFIVPLHYPTLAKMPLVLSNQLALSNRHIIFNCYKVVKIRWYQRGIFRLIFAIVLSIVFPGVGLLGASATVGATLGFTGFMAVVVGATVNALAAMFLMTIVEKAAVAIFGEKWGQIIAAIVGFAIMNDFANFNANGFTINWGQMMRMENLMKLMSSSADAVTRWIASEISGIQEDMVQLGEDYKDNMKDLEKQALDLLGYGGGVLDPLMFTQTQSRFLAPESREAFLQRTLMTGSDLIDLSMSMIEDYADLNLSLDVETI